MSGLAKSYEKAINKELKAHAAWYPISNTLKVGDYGVFEGGVFRSMGNLKDDYPEIELKIEDGPPAKIEFTSSGTNTTKFDADGNVTDSFASLGDAEAKLHFKFEKENSVVVKIEEIKVRQLQNINKVGMALAATKSWKRKYKVVSSTYTGKNSLLILAREAGAEFSISASADLLRSVEAGKVSAGFETSSSRTSTLNLVGESGVVALRLFKLRWLRDDIKFLEGDQLADAVEIQENLLPAEGEVNEDDF